MERDVIKHYYFNQQSIRDIAAAYGVSEQDIIYYKRRGLAALGRNKRLCRIIFDDY